MIERQLAINQVKQLYERYQSFSRIAEELGINPGHVWNAVMKDYASPGLVRALNIDETRTRFTADIPQHLKDDIQAERDRLNLKNNGEFLEYMWLFWKNFHENRD